MLGAVGWHSVKGCYGGAEDFQVVRVRVRVISGSGGFRVWVDRVWGGFGFGFGLRLAGKKGSGDRVVLGDRFYQIATVFLMLTAHM